MLTAYFEYVGCFPDEELCSEQAGCYRKGLPHGPGASAEIVHTPLSCKAACPQYKYFALQNGGECWCGNEYNNADLVTRQVGLQPLLMYGSYPTYKNSLGPFGMVPDKLCEKVQSVSMFNYGAKMMNAVYKTSALVSLPSFSVKLDGDFNVAKYWSKLDEASPTHQCSGQVGVNVKEIADLKEQVHTLTNEVDELLHEAKAEKQHSSTRGLAGVVEVLESTGEH